MPSFLDPGEFFHKGTRTLAGTNTGVNLDLKQSKAPQIQGPEGADIGQARQKFFADRRDELGRSQIGAQQEAGDALNRRFTALGQGGSGAAIGAGIKQRTAIDQEGKNQMNALGGQELQGIEADRQFDFNKQAANADLMNKTRAMDLAEGNYNLEKDSQLYNKEASFAASENSNKGK